MPKKKDAPTAGADLPANAADSLPAAPRVGGDVRGLEEVLPAQIKVPGIRIAQNSGERPVEVNPGEWFSKTTGVGMGKFIHLIPIALFNSRVMWPATDDLSDPPECSSLDARFPEDGCSPTQHLGKGGVVQEPEGKAHSNCLTCFFSQRHRDPDTRKRLPSACSFVANFFGLACEANEDGSADYSELDVCRIAFTRTGMPCGEQLINAAKFANPARDLWGTVFALHCDEVSKDGKRWWEPRQRQVGLTAVLAPDALQQAELLYAGWSEMIGRIRGEAMAEARDVRAEGTAVSNGGPAVVPGETPVGSPGGDDDLPF